MQSINRYQGRVIRVNEERVTAPDGRSLTLEIVRHPGGAGVLAVNRDNHVCLIHQFRHAAGGWIWEVPAGRRDHGEDPLNTAKRELREEVGVIAQSWRKLGAIWPTPGFCDEVIHLYLAQDLSQTDTAREEHEYMETHWLDFATAQAKIIESQTSDAKTLACWYLSQAYLRA